MSFTVLMVDDDGEYSKWLDVLRANSPGLTFQEQPAYLDASLSRPAQAMVDGESVVLVITAQHAQHARSILLRRGRELNAVFVDMTFSGEYVLKDRLEDPDL